MALPEFVAVLTKNVFSAKSALGASLNTLMFHEVFDYTRLR